MEGSRGQEKKLPISYTHNEVARPLIWLDGKIVKWEETKAHVLTHTLHYDASIFEGIRAYWTAKTSTYLDSTATW